MSVTKSRGGADHRTVGCIVDWPNGSVQTEVQAVTQDRAQGKWDQAKGVAKEKVGKVTGDRSTEVSGKLDQAKGKIEGKIGEAKDSIRHKDDRRR
jgi:uncharacterized protein YjbJ (UPF0337 family)